MRLIPTCQAKKDPIATKYCFIAKSIIHTSKHVPGPRKTVGVIFGFDKTPEVSSRIVAVSEALEAKGNYLIEAPELILMEVCPVEVSQNVIVQFFNEEDSPTALSGMDSEMSSSDIDDVLFNGPQGHHDAED